MYLWKIIHSTINNRAFKSVASFRIESQEKNRYSKVLPVSFSSSTSTVEFYLEKSNNDDEGTEIVIRDVSDWFQPSKGIKYLRNWILRSNNECGEVEHTLRVYLHSVRLGYTNREI